MDITLKLQSSDITQARTHKFPQCWITRLGFICVLFSTAVTQDCIKMQKCVNWICKWHMILERCVSCAPGKWRHDFYITVYRIVSCIRHTFFHGGEYQKSGVRLIYEYSKTRHLFLASHGAECYRHSFPTLKTHPTFILNVIRSQRLP